MSANWNGSHWIRPEKRLAIYIRDDFTCMYCGRSLKDAQPEELNLDHLMPRSVGGGNEARNLVTACKRCNSSRGNKLITEFAPGGALDRITHQINLPLNIALAKALIADQTGGEVENER